MSNLVRCDKCKEELPKKVNKKGFFNILTKTYEEIQYSWIFDDQKRKFKKTFHLCKACSEKLEDWMDL